LFFTAPLLFWLLNTYGGVLHALHTGCLSRVPVVRGVPSGGTPDGAGQRHHPTRSARLTTTPYDLEPKHREDSRRQRHTTGWLGSQLHEHFFFPHLNGNTPPATPLSR